MPDYGEIFCEAVEEVVKTQLRGLKYDLTQVCQVDDTSERDKGIYWVSTDAARFKAYSMTQNYEVGDTVYVTTPNNDATQQKIIIGKKVIGSQQDITYVMPFNNIKDITGNIINGSREVGRLANGNFNGKETCILEINRFETGFTRLGLQGSFRSQVADAIEGSYGLKLELCTCGTTDETKTVATFYLDADDMYGNPYNFDGYYIQQKVFDISTLAGFDVMRLYFYQDKDFKDRDGNLINSADSFGNGLKENLFVNDLYICLGYDIKDVYSDGLILYTNDGSLYDMTPRTKTISWRFIESLKDRKIKITTEADELPGGYKIWLFKENLDASYSDLAGAGWEAVKYNEEPLTQFQHYQFTTNYDLSSIKYKALITYNSRVIYESNVLEFINTIDTVAAKVDKLINSFYIYLADNSNGIYQLYDNKLASSYDANKTRYLYPAFKNADNEIEYITGVDRVKWIIPKENTMINFITPSKLNEIINIEFSFPNENYTSLEEYLEEIYFKEYGDDSPNYYIYKDKYYVYFFHPSAESGVDQKVSYTIKQNLNSNFNNNIIYCEIQHNNQTLKKELSLTFGEKIVNTYNVEIKFVNEEDRFTINDWDDLANEPIRKAIVAKLISPDGTEISSDKFTINWEWYAPNGNIEDYAVLFDYIEGSNPTEILIGLKEKINSYLDNNSIIKAVITYNNKIYEGYLPIILLDADISVENIITEFQEDQDYEDTIIIKKQSEELQEKNKEQYYAEIISSFGEDDKYSPQIEEGQIKDIPTNITNLEALYCYTILDENGGRIGSIPAFRKLSNLNNGEKEFTLPVEPPAVPQPTSVAEVPTVLSLRSTQNNTSEKNFIIHKTDLSSGHLTEGEVYNGVIVGNVTRQKLNKEENGLEIAEKKYGIYGVQGTKLTFAVDEDGDAYFGGKLQGATGQFNGVLSATEGNIGGWNITVEGLAYTKGEKTIAIVPTSVITENGEVPAIQLGDALLYAGDGGSFKITGTDINESLVTITDVNTGQDKEIKEMKVEINKLDKAVNRLNEEIFVNDTINPEWQEIEFVSDVTFNDNKLTVNKKKIKVLATSGTYDESSQDFNIE